MFKIPQLFSSQSMSKLFNPKFTATAFVWPRFVSKISHFSFNLFDLRFVTYQNSQILCIQIIWLLQIFHLKFLIFLLPNLFGSELIQKFHTYLDTNYSVSSFVSSQNSQVFELLNYVHSKYWNSKCYFRKISKFFCFRICLAPNYFQNSTFQHKVPSFVTSQNSQTLHLSCTYNLLNSKFITS